MQEKNLPKVCPSCGGGLTVRSLHCCACETHIEGDYALPAFMRLGADEQRFLVDFIKCRGSLKDLAALMGFSYPTVRNRLDDIILQLQILEQNEKGR